MLVDISKILVKDRIRKDFGDIQELADDIKINTLLNPPTVIPLGDGMYQLIAGERRLRACKMLGYTSITVNSISVKDAEHALRIEISENENRKEFSFSERMDYAKRLEAIERVKAEERMKDPMQTFAEGVEKFPQGTTRDIVAEATGFGSGEQYRKAKFVSDNADEETIRSLDEGSLSINAAYQRLMRDKQSLERQLQEKDISNSDKDLEIQELKIELKSLLSKQSEPVPQPVIPDDYDSLKKQVETLKSATRSAKDEAAEARNEAAAYKQSLETWKAGGRSFDQISLPDFKFAVRAFLKDAGPLVYMGDQFKDIKSTEKDKFREELDVIERWIIDMRQALDGNSVGANLIIIEGGQING